MARRIGPSGTTWPEWKAALHTPHQHMPGYDPVRDSRGADAAPHEAPDTDTSAPGVSAPTSVPMPQPSAPAPADAKPIPYQPKYRWSQPDSVLRPITQAEIDEVKANSQNPMRYLDRPAEMPRVGRVRPRKHTMDNSEAVADHYNKRRDVGREAREASPILPLKRFNNWIKSGLIAMFARPARDAKANARVLDMGCGKGGDLLKWDRQHPSLLVMIDIAEVSVAQAQQRYDAGHFKWPAAFFAFDCFREPLAYHIPEEMLEPQFDTVTMQFCMHYGWDTEEHARMMLENAAKHLRLGGTFLGTTLDADTLMARLEALDDADALAFGNDNYRIEFEHRYAPGEKPFGNKYRFWLEDAVDDVAEYVVDWPTFERLANEYGLRLLYKARFDQVLADGYARSQLRSLLERMRVIDAEEVAQTGVVTPAMPPALWDVCTLYIGFAFEKV